MLQYLAFSILSFLALRVPPRIAYVFCDLIGRAAFGLLGERRAMVMRNLGIVTGAEPRKVRQLARETFKQGVRYYYDTFSVPAVSDAEITRLVKMEGLEIFDRAMALGKGVVLFTAHFGSPAIVVQTIAMRGYPITAMAEPIKPQKLFDLVNGARSARGISVLPIGPTSFRDLSTRLARNEVAGIVADRDLQGSGISVMLFGKETTLPAGPVVLALRTGAVLLPAFSIRLDGGRFGGWVGEPVVLERTGDLKADVRANTRKVAAVLEDAIRRAPEQWVVFEDIWPEGRRSGEEVRAG